MADSEIVAQCEITEAQQEQEQEWGPISDGDLLRYVLQIEAGMDGKRIAEAETETNCGILFDLTHAYYTLSRPLSLYAIYKYFMCITSFNSYFDRIWYRIYNSQASHISSFVHSFIHSFITFIYRHYKEPMQRHSTRISVEFGIAFIILKLAIFLLSFIHSFILSLHLYIATTRSLCRDTQLHILIEFGVALILKLAIFLLSFIHSFILSLHLYIATTRSLCRDTQLHILIEFGVALILKLAIFVHSFVHSFFQYIYIAPLQGAYAETLKSIFL